MVWEVFVSASVTSCCADTSWSQAATKPSEAFVLPAIVSSHYFINPDVFRNSEKTTEPEISSSLRVGLVTLRVGPKPLRVRFGYQIAGGRF